MDGVAPSISCRVLYKHLGTASAPVLIDVRRHESFSADDQLIVGAFHRAPADVQYWRTDLPAGRPVVAYCSDGGTASRSVANALREEGMDAAYLEGGISGWKKDRLPLRKRLGAIETRWVTREHPKIDRIACPWVISRFINPFAEFIYVPATEVLAVAKDRRATPYDIKGAEFGYGRSLLVRCGHPDLRHQGHAARPPGNNRKGRGHLPAGSHAAMRRFACDLVRAVSELSGRS